MLLAGAGLMLRTLANLRAIDVGFRSDRLLTLRTTLPLARYRDRRSGWAFYDRVIVDTRALPGVEDAAYISTLPFQSSGNTIFFAIEGGAADPASPPTRSIASAPATICSPSARRLVEGRLLDDRDGAGAPLAVVVNDDGVALLARRVGARAPNAVRQPAKARRSRSSASSKTCASAATSWP